jgi:serine/threonine protein kinase
LILEPGTRVDDRYEILQFINSGAMATVYKVQHLGLRSIHALKVLNEDLANSEDLRSRFLEEGRIQAQLKHPNIVQVTEIVTSPAAGLIMDYVEGPDLARYLAERLAVLSSEGPSALGTDEVLKLMLPVLDAIDMAHERGVIHRDLKPENIIVGRDTRGRIQPKVADFGIAKVLATATVDGRKRKTQTGTRMGTLLYMSPEQVRGEELDSRSDIFAVGAILYEVVTGRIAFDATTEYDTMKNIVEGHFEPPERVVAGLHPMFAACVRKALAVDPAERFQSCDEFSVALSSSTDPNAPLPSKPSRSYAKSKPPEKRAKTIHKEPPPAAIPVYAILDTQRFRPINSVATADVSESWEAPAFNEAATQAAMARIRLWGKAWPEEMSHEVKLVHANPVSCQKIVATVIAEQRTAMAMELPFPDVQVDRASLRNASEIDPWVPTLPSVSAKAETGIYVVDGSVSPRKCAECKGRSQVDCGTCDGSAKVDCTRCGGEGMLGCGACNNSGQVWSERSPHHKKCPNCSGKGAVRCSQADCTKGRAPCGHCNGSGNVDCMPCGALGKVADVIAVHRTTAVGVYNTLIGPPDIPPAVVASVKALEEPGRLAARMSGLSPVAAGVARTLAKQVQSVMAAATQQATRQGGGWRVAANEIQVFDIPLVQITYSVRGRSYQVWLPGERGALFAARTPAQDWREDRLNLAVSQLQQGSIEECLSTLAPLRQLDNSDAHINELCEGITGALVEIWNSSGPTVARTLSAKTISPISENARQALQPLENSLAWVVRKRQALLCFPMTAALVAAGALLEHLGAAGATMTISIWTILSIAVSWVPLERFIRNRPDTASRTWLPLWVSGAFPSLLLLWLGFHNFGPR